MDVLQFLGFTAAFLLLFISVFVTVGHFGGRKPAPPLSFYSLGRDLDFEGLVALSSAVASKEIKFWNQYNYGEPYIVSEQIIKKGKRYSYIAVPKGFESDFQGYLLLRSIRFFKVGNPIPIEAESILVSDFSFRNIGSLNKLNSMVMPIAHSQYGGAAVQMVLRGKREGGFELNSRLATFGDDHEARKLFYAISGNARAQHGSKKLEEAMSLRLFREKNVERYKS